MSQSPEAKGLRIRFCGSPKHNRFRSGSDIFFALLSISKPSPFPPVGGRGVVLDDYFFYLFLNVLRTLRRIEQQLKSIEGARLALNRIILFIKFHEMNIRSVN